MVLPREALSMSLVSPRKYTATFRWSLQTRPLEAPARFDPNANQVCAYCPWRRQVGRCGASRRALKEIRRTQQRNELRVPGRRIFRKSRFSTSELWIPGTKNCPLLLSPWSTSGSSNPQKTNCLHTIYPPDRSTTP